MARGGRARHGSIQDGRDGPLSVAKALRAARKAREEFEPGWKAYKRAKVGPHYQKGKGDRRLVPYVAMYESALLPELAAKNGEGKVKAVLELTDGTLAQLIGVAGNIVLRRQEFVDQLRLCVLDSFYAFMFGQVFNEVTEATSHLYGPAGEPYYASMPGFERLPPACAIWDPTGLMFTQCGYVGHEFASDQDTAEHNPRYEEKVRREMARQPRSAEQVANDFDRERFGTAGTVDQDEMAHRHKMVQLYVRATNTIYTLWEHSQDQFKIARKDSFWGPRRGRGNGPYHMRGYLPVGDETVPLAPAMSWWEQLCELEAIAQHNNENAKAEKNGVTCKEGDEAKLKAWQKNPNQHAVSGVEDVAEVHTGGVTQEGQAYEATRWQVLEMASALRAVGKQNIGQDTTATTAAIIAGGSNNQTGDRRGEVAKFAGGIFDSVCWHIYEDENVSIPTTLQVPVEPGVRPIPVELELQGGPPADAFGFSMPQPEWHERFWTEMDPKSLYVDNDEVRRARAGQDAAFALGPMRMLLNSQGMDLDGYQFTQWYGRETGMGWIEGMVVPLSPMAMRMIMQGQQRAQGEGRTVLKLTEVGKDPVQSGVMNSAPTNGLIRNGTRDAGFMREAATPYGAHNPVGVA